jgi:hypothetical protein
MMQPQADGRTYACQYCGTRVQVAIDASQLAAGMAFDAGNLEASMAQLARMLLQAVPQRARAQFQQQWLMMLEVDLDKDKFIAVREGQQLVTRHQKIVRGVALKNATLTPDQWLAGLTRALARIANDDAKAAWVLGQISPRR